MTQAQWFSATKKFQTTTPYQHCVASYTKCSALNGTAHYYLIFRTNWGSGTCRSKKQYGALIKKVGISDGGDFLV